MTKDEAIEIACALTALVYNSKKDYRYPSDGFCSKCPSASSDWKFENSGQSFYFIRDAIVQKLSRDGETINSRVLNEVDAILKKCIRYEKK
jgi:hypothetical protein